MSELTECNYCTLKKIRKRARTRTYVRPGKGEWDGWILVTQKGKSEPIAYFKALTDHCVC